ncbi:hypothetical protein SAMN05421780_105238 [Flexibacter flexilis DSM 6793]|uniref:Uncharacterized protein n=1 Tax=Flexibacter flexilis DSM 6793 TaxID=927664 RepID=A0A1I1J839_9BACT|nr:hypothetical protein [Flexibacter flexilis]SFC44616.1 hypothetical protein SAMN05421780_105238 [Flexibacter flexilis DSM 6793]
MEKKHYYDLPFGAKAAMLFLLLGVYKLNSPQSHVWQKTAEVGRAVRVQPLHNHAEPITASLKNKHTETITKD